MHRVWISGIGLIPVGDRWRKSLVDMAVEASTEALGTRKPDLIIVANMHSSLSSQQENVGAIVANAMGLSGTPSFKVEAGSASGGMASHLGRTMIANGSLDSVLVVGVEKLMDLPPTEIVRGKSMNESYEVMQFFGITESAAAALITRLYMEEYEITRRELSSFSVLAHRNAVKNPHAQFRREVTPEQVEKSSLISDPLRLLDCAPSGDGAAAVLITNSQEASTDVEMLTSASATGLAGLHERDELLEFGATRSAAAKVFSEAGVSRDDLDLAEIQDDYSGTAGLVLEGLGISKKGEGTRDCSNGRFDQGSRLSISNAGGLKARGNPLGATGVYQIAEIASKLIEGGDDKKAILGLAHNSSGLDSNAVVHLLRRG